MSPRSVSSHLPGARRARAPPPFARGCRIRLLSRLGRGATGTAPRASRSAPSAPVPQDRPRKDPFELVSRHNDPAYASVRGQLAAELQKLRNCAGASCRTHP
jgi:hypothetical protein